MLILVSFLSLRDAVLLLPKQTATTQWDKVFQEAKLREDFQQPLSLFLPNARIKHKMALQRSSGRHRFVDRGELFQQTN